MERIVERYRTELIFVSCGMFMITNIMNTWHHLRNIWLEMHECSLLNTDSVNVAKMGGVCILSVLACFLIYEFYYVGHKSIFSDHILTAFLVLMILLWLVLALICINFHLIHGTVNEKAIECIAKYDEYDLTSDVTRALNDIQDKNGCCGISGPTDWQHNVHYNGSGYYPRTCCGWSNSVTCLNFSISLHTEGCAHKVPVEELKIWSKALVIVLEMIVFTVIMAYV